MCTEYCAQGPPFSTVLLALNGRRHLNLGSLHFLELLLDILGRIGQYPSVIASVSSKAFLEDRGASKSNVGKDDLAHSYGGTISQEFARNVQSE